jgi:hypothetical protein
MQAQNTTVMLQNLLTNPNLDEGQQQQIQALLAAMAMANGESIENALIGVLESASSILDGFDALNDFVQDPFNGFSESFRSTFTTINDIATEINEVATGASIAANVQSLISNLLDENPRALADILDLGSTIFDNVPLFGDYLELLSTMTNTAFNLMGNVATAKAHWDTYTLVGHVEGGFFSSDLFDEAFGNIMTALSHSTAYGSTFQTNYQNALDKLQE